MVEQLLTLWKKVRRYRDFNYNSGRAAPARLIATLCCAVLLSFSHYRISPYICFSADHQASTPGNACCVRNMPAIFDENRQAKGRLNLRAIKTQGVYRTSCNCAYSLCVTPDLRPHQDAGIVHAIIGVVVRVLLRSTRMCRWNPPFHHILLYFFPQCHGVTTSWC